jgi:hypothetical protein
MSARGMLEETNKATDGVSNVSSIGADKTRLDLGADDEWEARWARLQRIAWIIMGFVLLLAIAGVFGRGPVDHATVADNGNQFRVDYAPVLLFRTPAVLTLHLSPALAGSDHLVHVQASKALLAPLQIQRVDPQPAQWGVGPSGPEMAFRVSLATGDGAVELEIDPGAGLFNALN